MFLPNIKDVMNNKIILSAIAVCTVGLCSLSLCTQLPIIDQEAWVALMDASSKKAQEVKEQRKVKAEQARRYDEMRLFLDLSNYLEDEEQDCPVPTTPPTSPKGKK